VTESIRGAMIRAWESLMAGPSGDREWRALRIETGHPLDVFAAVREQDQTRGVLFECPISLAPAWRLRFDSEGLRLFDDRAGRDGSRRIALALERAELESVFLVIADDLIASSKAAGDIQEAVAALGARLAAWQMCLKVRRDGFGQERMLGLYGELVLLERLASTIGLDRAIASWTGPERGLHDFEAAGVAIEVKTSLGARGAVHIGSLDQLDPSGLQQLALYRVVLVSDGAGTDLSQLVVGIRRAADGIGHIVRRTLDQRLLMSGYIDPDDRSVPFDRLAVIALDAYEVRGDFPRLTRENVGSAVLAAEYRLDVAGAENHRMTAEALQLLLARFGMGG
jgi:hypothetical protein